MELRPAGQGVRIEQCRGTEEAGQGDVETAREAAGRAGRETEGQVDRGRRSRKEGGGRRPEREGGRPDRGALEEAILGIAQRRPSHTGGPVGDGGGLSRGRKPAGQRDCVEGIGSLDL